MIYEKFRRMSLLLAKKLTLSLIQKGVNMALMSSV